MSKKTLILALVLYFVSSVSSFAGFSLLARGPQEAMQLDSEVETEVVDEDLLLTIDPEEPRDQVCPLNGALYTQTEREAWENKRPLAIMIENHPEARPQSGLSQADIVFETIAEGGVTRFMGLFYCDAQRKDVTVAPVRSARTYFVDWASGFNWPLYVHVGGANVPGPTDALGQISDYGWNGENDLNQFSIGYPVFVRDYNRLGKDRQLATEHTMVSSTQKLWDYAAEERDWTNLAPERTISRSLEPGSDWKDGYKGLAFEESEAEPGDTINISYDFWSGYNDYSVAWTFNPETKLYTREMGGEAHTDLNNDEQIAVSNVVVLLTTEKGPINEKKHMLYGTTGTGKALVFKNGEAVSANWSKDDRESELEFTDSKGKVLAFEPGKIWISVIDKGNEVEY